MQLKIKILNGPEKSGIQVNLLENRANYYEMSNINGT